MRTSGLSPMISAEEAAMAHSVGVSAKSAVVVSEKVVQQQEARGVASALPDVSAFLPQQSQTTPARRKRFAIGQSGGREVVAFAQGTAFFGDAEATPDIQSIAVTSNAVMPRRQKSLLPPL